MFDDVHEKIASVVEMEVSSTSTEQLIQVKYIKKTEIIDVNQTRGGEITFSNVIDYILDYIVKNVIDYILDYILKNVICNLDYRLQFWKM